MPIIGIPTQAVDKRKRTVKMGGPCVCGLILTATNNFATLLRHSAHTNIRPIFNTPHSPDLSPIENCWRAVKQYISVNISITGLGLMEVGVGWLEANTAVEDQPNGGFYDSADAASVSVWRSHDRLVNRARLRGTSFAI